MVTKTEFDNSLNAIIKKKDSCKTISFFACTARSKNNICILEIRHVSIKEAYDILKHVFETPNRPAHLLRFQILKIINDVLTKRLKSIDGYVKSMQSTLGAAVLVRAPYYEPFLDIRIAVADNWDNLEKAKDFIFYELGIGDLRAMNPT